MSKREAHLRQLAADEGVTLSLNRRGDTNGSYADVFGASIFGWDGRKQAPYFVALHELGHLACGHLENCGQNYLPRILESEAEAWQWALDHAAETPNADTLRAIRNVWLGSYVRDYGLRTGGTAFESVQLRIGAYC